MPINRRHALGTIGLLTAASAGIVEVTPYFDTKKFWEGITTCGLGAYRNFLIPGYCFSIGPMSGRQWPVSDIINSSPSWVSVRPCKDSFLAICSRATKDPTKDPTLMASLSPDDADFIERAMVYCRKHPFAKFGDGSPAPMDWLSQ